MACSDEQTASDLRVLNQGIAKTAMLVLTQLTVGEASHHGE
jgi:hypothetical protein